MGFTLINRLGEKNLSAAMTKGQAIKVFISTKRLSASGTDDTNDVIPLPVG